jgi:hypothetical protein
MSRSRFEGKDKIIHDPNDPNPWYALYLDQSTPICDTVKERWLRDSASRSRQYFLPFARPWARFWIVIVQIIKALSPIDWRALRAMHRVIAFSLKTFVRADANYLILRHFHAGSEILAFIAGNVRGINVPLNPLKPKCLDDLVDNTILKHDINVYNFIINLNLALKEHDLKIQTLPPDEIDYSMITDGEFAIDPMPSGWLNFVDLETAIELYTPFFQFMLTDNDFWRATNSLQLDETIAMYGATILGSAHHMMLVNNKHPMVSLITLYSGFRLVLHGLSTEMAHWLLVQKKREQAARKVRDVPLQTS